MEKECFETAAGDIFLELKEIDRMSAFSEEADSVQSYKTYGDGGFLTLICCNP